MDIDKKNLKYLIFLLIFTIVLLSWLALLFWWAKYEFFYNPLLFIPIGIVVGFIILVPCYFFIRTIRKILNKERIEFSKRSILGAILVIFLFSSLTIIAFLFFTIPSAVFLYNHNNGPYLIWNDDPQTSMTIIWLTENPEDTKLEYGKHVNDLTAVQGFTGKRHMIELKNLESDTTYYYKIPGFSNKIYEFRTAPSTTTAFNFTVIGDNRNGGGIELSNYGDIINAMKPYNYDFIINVGDVYVNGNDMDSINEFLNNMEKHASNHPYMIAIGNHEYGGGDLFASNFKYFFPYQYANCWNHYYSFDYSNAHFIMLDNFDNPLAGGHYISEVQLAWLKSELAANQDKWLFVSFHIPPYSTGDFNMDKKLSDQLAPIFYKYKVDVVLTGHDHHYEAFWTNRTEDWGGTYYFISGGGGASLDSFILDREINPWKTKVHNASNDPYQFDYVTLHDQIYGELTHQFMHFEVNGDKLHIQAIRDNNTLIQEYFITK
ncbi:MAG: metallophosphoesterase [Promethearchaeota archaeon]